MLCCILYTLSDSVLCNQHHAEPRFALHHAGVSIGSLFERKCLDHRADILKDAEGKGVLAINRRAGQAPVDGATSKNERERIQLDRVLRYTDHDEFPAGCKTGHKWPHGITTGGCCENRTGPAHTLQHRCTIVGGSIGSVTICSGLYFFIGIAALLQSEFSLTSAGTKIPGQVILAECLFWHFKFLYDRERPIRMYSNQEQVRSLTAFLVLSIVR